MLKVTVIIPVYNTEKYLRDSLDSVVGQTLKDIEIICVDDGSSDGSIPVLEEYAAKDGRVRILRQEHRGAGAARNLGMSKAKGKYLYFLDSDDWIAPDMLEKMYAEAEKLGADVVVCHADRFLDGSNERHSFHNYVENMLPSRKPFVDQDVPYNLFGTFIWWVSDRFYLRSFVEKIGIRFQELPSMEDLLFSVATMLKARRISYIPDILSHQRARKDSLTATQYKTWDTYYRAFITIKDFMKNEGIYEFWKQDFINHCVRFSLWQLQILPETVSKKLAALLREKGCHELGLLGLSSYYFYEPKQYFDFLKALGSIEMDALIYREAGYNFLYPCYRLLVECEPQSILEFHLGRVTKLVAGYAAKAGAGHLVLENRPKEQVERMIAQWDMPFRSTEFRGGVLLQARRPGELGVAYQHFEELAGNRQYDLILLTCPPGGDTLPHMDLLPLLPGILRKDFAILMDHAESRYGKRILQDMADILSHHHILFEREDFTDDNGTVALLVSKGWEHAMEGVRR